MNIELKLNCKDYPTNIIVMGVFQKDAPQKDKKSKKEEKKEVSTTGWSKEVKDAFHESHCSHSFTGEIDTTDSFEAQGKKFILIGLGQKKSFNSEGQRKAGSKIQKTIRDFKDNICLDVDSITKGSMDKSIHSLLEGYLLSMYDFDKYKSQKNPSKVKKLYLTSKTKATTSKKLQKVIEESQAICESVNVARDFVNEPPNVLNSEYYAKEVEKDAKKIKGVKVKVLGKADLKKEKMGMFLSVNAGSAYQPQLVHLTYTPSKVTSKTKHIALVGKGLTFDTGGYSLKPSASMINMKFDMAGSATVYGAFRAAALLGLPIKVSCFLGMTDNAVNSLATMPDSIVKARNGKTVEILNTDAEGRLVLGDVLSYASDFKPDAMIDAATLTGACLVALGTEVCGLMSNDQKLADKLSKAAKNTDEYIWQLPIIDEWRNDMKSNIADLKNIGSTRFAGTAKAAAFLENFVSEGISWAHLDIAGIGDSQSHLPYCPAKGASGMMVRTLVDFIKSYS